MKWKMSGMREKQKSPLYIRTLSRLAISFCTYNQSHVLFRYEN